MEIKVKDYEIELLKLVGDADEKKEIEFEMDFSNPAHRNNFYERYGGKETLEKEFPDLAAAVERTAKGKNCRKTANCIRNAQGELTDTGDLRNSVRIADTLFDVQQGALGFFNLLQTSPRVYMSLTILNGNRILKRARDFLSRESLGSLSCILQESEKVSEGEELTYVYNVSWQDPVSGDMHDSVRVRKGKIILSDAIESIELYHPCMYHDNLVNGKMPNLHTIPTGSDADLQFDIPEKVTDRPDDNINVCYARGARNGEVVDYVYPEERDSAGDQEVFLDIRGKVYLNEGYEFDCATEVDCILDSVSWKPSQAYTGSGVIWYDVANNILLTKHIFKTDDGFGFIFPTNWGAVIPESVVASQRLYFLETDIHFKCKNSDNEYVAKIIHSDRTKLDDPNSHSVEVSPIYLLWGCLAEGSKISMADGSQNAIEHIKPEDQVRTQDGSAVRVTDVVKGTEKYMYLFETESGSRILVSAYHPLLTQEGWKAACDITEADSLITEANGPTKVQVRNNIAYYGNVYSLVVDGANNFIAEGLVVGDNCLQGALSAEKVQQRQMAVAPVIQAECEKLRKWFR
jgi:hypothetical protein